MPASANGETSTTQLTDLCSNSFPHQPCQRIAFVTRSTGSMQTIRSRPRKTSATCFARCRRNFSASNCKQSRSLYSTASSLGHKAQLRPALPCTVRSLQFFRRLMARFLFEPRTTCEFRIEKVAEVIVRFASLLCQPPGIIPLTIFGGSKCRDSFWSACFAPAASSRPPRWKRKRIRKPLGGVRSPSRAS